jgi:hypothetical protein
MTRKSVPTEGVHQWWPCGWQYIMPDFDKPDHSIVEWSSEKLPVYPIQSTTEHSAHGLRSPIYGEG